MYETESFFVQVKAKSSYWFLKMEYVAFNVFV